LRCVEPLDMQYVLLRAATRSPRAAAAFYPLPFAAVKPDLQ
jgi:hypothetical protein